MNVQTNGIRVRSRWAKRLITFFMVAGPGLIVMEADNDAGAVSTYMQAGAQYGTHLLWILLLLLPITYFVQEMVVRLGIATGKGHAAMIYQRFGKWWGHFSFFDLQLVNFLTLITEFAAFALAFSKLGIPPVIAVPLCAVGIVALVMTGSYLRWERIVIGLCLFDLIWVALALKSETPLTSVIQSTLLPSLPAGGITGSLVFLVIGIVGTTIAPWQLFFQQSCIADKRLRFSDLNLSRLDTFIGASFTVAIAGCMMLVGNLSRIHGFTFTDPAQVAVDLKGVVGNTLHQCLLLLMVNAGMLGSTAISLSSAWAYGEVRGVPHSLQLPFRKAKGFYSTYAICVFAAAGIVLIPRVPLQLVIVSVQVLAGLMLPSAIIFLQLLLNDTALLGKRWTNQPWNNWINWIIIIALFALSMLLAAQIVLPDIFPQ